MSIAVASTSQTPTASTTYYPLVLILCALIAGIAWDRYWPMAAEAWWLAAWAALFAWFLLRLSRWQRIASCALLAGFLATGGVWHHGYWRLYRSDDAGRMVNEEFRPLVIEAIALTSPRWVPAPPPTALRTIPQDDKTELLVWVTSVRDGRTWRPASGYASLDVEGNLPGIRASDRIRVMAQAARPAPPLNPGEFDFAAHERSRRVHCRLFAEFPESVERTKAGRAWSPRRWLGEARGGGTALLRSYIAPNRSTLAAAVLLGAREQLDPERNEGFLVTGTIHVLSISGLHVGILAAGLFVVFRSGLLPRRLALIAVMLLTCGYALLTDLQPPVVRATIIVVAMCVALFSNRPALGFNTLAAAALVVLAINPASLFQAGPQLSFLAVATIIAAQRHVQRQPIIDPLDRLIASTRPWPWRAARAGRDFVWRLWLTGALVWLVSTPLVWSQYQLLSPIALVLNVLLWIPIAVALYSGFAVLLAGWLFPPLGRGAAWLCDASLGTMEQAIAWGREQPLAYGWQAAPPWWWVGLLYATLAACVAFPLLRPSRLWCCSLAVMWSAGALLLSSNAALSFRASPERPLVCSFVSVGHGVSVLVELPDGRNLLYDAGRLGTPLGAVRPVSSVLWSRRISRLDAIVISHADADHFNAIPELLARFDVGVIYVSPVMFEREPPALAELRAAIEAAGVPVRELYGGQRLAGGEATTIDVLHPPRKGVLGSDNANSIVLLIEHAGRRFLLTGDLESPGLDDVLAERPLDCDVVLAPHHGSPRSAPGAFADWCSPEFVVISGGRSAADISTIERVKDTFRLRGAEVFHTAEDGCVRFDVNEDGIAATSFRQHVRARPQNDAAANLLQAE
jgi:competence protein ComEC